MQEEFLEAILKVRVLVKRAEPEARIRLMDILLQGYCHVCGDSLAEVDIICPNCEGILSPTPSVHYN